MNKLARFNLVVPLFKAGKMYFPLVLKSSKIMGEMMQEIQLATLKGLKSKHDDFIDTVSMLMYLTPWKPSEDAPPAQSQDGIYGIEEDDDPSGQSSITSYIV